MLNDVHVFDCHTSSWIPPAVSGDIPAARAGHTSVVIEDKLYIFGGADGVSYLNELHVLDCVRMEWMMLKTTGAIPAARTRHASVSTSPDKMFVIGGTNGTFLFDNIHCLNTVSATWTEIALPTKRWGHTVVSVDDTLYLFGGHNGRAMCNDLISLDTRANESEWRWVVENVANGPCPRAGHSMCVHGSQLLVFGGGAPQGMTNDLLSFALDTRSWQQPSIQGHPPAARAGHTSLSVGTFGMYVFGGGDANGRRFKDLYVLENRKRWLSRSAHNNGATNLETQREEAGVAEPLQHNLAASVRAPQSEGHHTQLPTDSPSLSSTSHTERRLAPSATQTPHLTSSILSTASSNTNSTPITHSNTAHTQSVAESTDVPNEANPITHPVEQLTETFVTEQILDSLGLDQYRPIFCEARLGPSTFEFITDSHLRELGVTNPAHRLRLLAAFNQHLRRTEAVRREGAQQLYSDSSFQLAVSLERLALSINVLLGDLQSRDIRRLQLEDEVSRLTTQLSLMSRELRAAQDSSRTQERQLSPRRTSESLSPRKAPSKWQPDRPLALALQTQERSRSQERPASTVKYQPQAPPSADHSADDSARSRNTTRR
eukprot:c32854_g1_i1.p1 GENE.c32854_g1_i1~~c32854_g1_i1.p1  ORF type:complete len:654 (-),score=103.14 c32854_g1_i1:69-1874(-)